MNAILLEENIESIAVLASLGFENQGKVKLEGDEEEMLLYAIEL